MKFINLRRPGSKPVFVVLPSENRKYTFYINNVKVGQTWRYNDRLPKHQLPIFFFLVVKLFRQNITSNLFRREQIILIHESNTLRNPLFDSWLDDSIGIWYPCGPNKTRTNLLQYNILFSGQLEERDDHCPAWRD